VINGLRVFGLIPARGGSKGVPRKNLRILGGKPLIQWSAEAAATSAYIDRLVLSSDDHEIIAVARSIGLEAPFLRPAAAASDTASARDVIEHALGLIGEDFDVLVYLQPTSPFRSGRDIDGCLEALVASGADACVSVTESRTKPEWLFRVDPESRLKPVLGTPTTLRRQELEPAYELNGAVYAARIPAYRRAGTFLTDQTLAWIMPTDRSLDLDEPEDFDRAETLLGRSNMQDS
jgi:CMP-N,N'-diacetyllegionaminic acid synthase